MYYPQSSSSSSTTISLPTPSPPEHVEENKIDISPPWQSTSTIINYSYDAQTYPNTYRQHVLHFFIVKSGKQQQHQNGTTTTTNYTCPFENCSSGSRRFKSEHFQSTPLTTIRPLSSTITMLDKFTGLVVPIHQIATKRYMELVAMKSSTKRQQHQLMSAKYRQNPTTNVLPSMLRPMHNTTIRDTMPAPMFHDLLQSYLNHLDQIPNIELWLEVARDNGFYPNINTGRVVMNDWYPQWPDLTVEQGFLIRCWPFEHYPEFLERNSKHMEIVYIQYYDANTMNDQQNRLIDNTQLCAECVHQNCVITRFADIEIKNVQFDSEAAKDSAILDGIDLNYKITLTPVCWFERLNLLVDDRFWCRYCKHTPLFIPTC